jgi:hypothetical protein
MSHMQMPKTTKQPNIVIFIRKSTKSMCSAPSVLIMWFLGFWEGAVKQGRIWAGIRKFFGAYADS